MLEEGRKLESATKLKLKTRFQGDNIDFNVTSTREEEK